MSSGQVRERGPYPTWKFYPSRSPAPPWVDDVLGAFATAADDIDSRTQTGVSSDAVLAAVRPGLLEAWFEVETGKTKADKITRPVLFGENGAVLVSYDVDGYHPNDQVVLEVEAGRGAASNADYRDLVRASLMVSVSYLVLAMMLNYTGGGHTIRSYEVARSRLDAVFASDRLSLPLQGVLLVGY